MVGFKCVGRIGDIFSKLQAEAWLNKGVTVAEYDYKKRLARIIAVENTQFGEERMKKKGISLDVVNKMFDIEDEAMRIVDRIFTTNDREEKLLLDERLCELEKNLKPLSELVTIGKTKHSEEYNSVLVLDIVKRYGAIPRERLYSVIKILTEEDLI